MAGEARACVYALCARVRQGNMLGVSRSVVKGIACGVGVSTPATALQFELQQQNRCASSSVCFAGGLIQDDFCVTPCSFLSYMCTAA